MKLSNLRNLNKNKKALSPIISAILLLVVGIILVLVILSWGKNFTNKSLNKANNVVELKVSDAANFVYPKSTQDGTLLINYTPPSSIENENITITGYQLLDVLDSKIVTLQTPVTLKSNGLSLIQLDCLYERTLSDPDFTIQMITDQNTYINVKIRDPGMVCSSGGTGTEDDPIVICDAEDLNNVRNDLAANYVLGKDIDLFCYLKNDVNGWLPIGIANKFKGSFDGQHHVIKNLQINRPNTTYIGFFDSIDEDSIVKNVGFKDANICGGKFIGSLAGRNYGVITSAYATGHVLSTGLGGGGHANTGGLVGVNYGGAIRQSYFEGNVEAHEKGTMVGGLIGQNIWGGHISDCYAKGSVYGVGTYVGGLSGANDCAGSTNCLIENCYADCSVVGLSEAVGGLVGAAHADTAVIKQSYCKGSVTGRNNVGGFVGYNLVDSSINSNYAFSDVFRSSGGGGKY